MKHSYDHVARRTRRPAALVGLCLSLGAVACAENGPTSPNTPDEADRPSISITLPAPVSSVRASANDEGGVLIVWTDASSNEEGFRVLRSIDGGAFEEVGIGAANTETYGDYTVQSGKAYRYAVASFNTVGQAIHVTTPVIQVD